MLRPKSTLWKQAQGAPVHRIRALQQKNGAIPWCEAGIFDAWNHIESAMALSVAGYEKDAVRAFDFLAKTQAKDGSWWGHLGNAAPLDKSNHYYLAIQKTAPRIRDSNFIAYIATGIWYHYLVHNKITFLKSLWPTLSAAINFVVSLQSREGEIRWAARSQHAARADALIAGCSSIFKSLECAIHIANTLKKTTTSSRWQSARAKLGHALREKPQRFDRTWTSKENFSMSWYYPVLAGVWPKDTARKLLQEQWNKFVIEGMGCLCVHEEPWVTVAESAELCLALLSVGEKRKAHQLYQWQQQWRDADGVYWMGWQSREKKFWPQEKPSWTQASMVLCAYALTHKTAAARIFGPKP